jgi:hypothetical protein
MFHGGIFILYCSQYSPACKDYSQQSYEILEDEAAAINMKWQLNGKLLMSVY